MKRSILTIATGKELFVNLAANLARSFFFWHKNTEIDFIIVTDLPELIPKDLVKKIKIIKTEPGQLGFGFTPKLYLDQLATEGQTIFIDSDCLIFKNLDSVFERFKGHSVSVIGNYISDGEWFGDVKSICKKFGITQIPKFNGGIYYLEKGKIASDVYQLARQLENQYDEIGFVRLRNRPNDEVLMALAMQLNNQKPLIDDGTIMSDPQACPGGYYIDVIKGETWLLNPPAPNPLHQHWYPFEKVEPVVFHFLGYFTNHYPYRREVFRLEKALCNNLDWRAELKAKITIEYPERLKDNLKKVLRPLYRTIVGVRKVKQSERVV